MQMRTALDDFLLSYSGARSPATVAWYRRRLGELGDFLGDVDVGRVTISDLRRFRCALESRGLAVRTRHGYVRAVRRFFAWLVEEGVLPVNVALRLELPRLPKGEVKGIRQEDLCKMFAVAASSPRDLALCWVFYSTGARLGGVVGLGLADLDLEHGRARVTEKFTKSRTVYLVPRAVEALRAWLAVRPDMPGVYSVFVGKRGKLTGSGVYQVMASIAERAGVGPGWNPHNWRHKRARDLLAAGVGLGVVSQVLGHSGVQVTADIYGLLDEAQLQNAVNGVQLAFQ